MVTATELSLYPFRLTKGTEQTSNSLSSKKAVDGQVFRGVILPFQSSKQCDLTKERVQLQKIHHIY